MTRMSASEAFVETLVAQGVTHVFGIVGSAYMDALDLFEPAGIRFISVAHEQGAGHMADGFARATGRQGVCIAQNGPGITNFVTAVAAAYWAHSPVVVITPETGSNTHRPRRLPGDRAAALLLEDHQISRPMSPTRRALPSCLSRCFDYALLERGPTQFNIPRDIFYGEFDATIPKPIRVERPAGGPNSLEEAAKLLAGAEFPVIVAGGGVIMSDGVDEVVELAEHLDAPVVNTYLHNDSFPKIASPLDRPDRLSGLQGGDEADRPGRRRAGARHPPRPLRHPAAARHRLLAEERQDHPGRQRPSAMLGLVKQAAVGVCGDARAAAVEILRTARDREPRPSSAQATRAGASPRWRSRRPSGRPS